MQHVDFPDAKQIFYKIDKLFFFNIVTVSVGVVDRPPDGADWSQHWWSLSLESLLIKGAVWSSSETCI